MQTLREIASRRELFVNLTLRELRSKYKRSVLGWAWSMLNPLTTLVIYATVFGIFLRVEPDTGDPSGLKNFAMFLMCGLLPYTFLANGLNANVLRRWILQDQRAMAGLVKPAAAGMLPVVVREAVDPAEGHVCGESQIAAVQRSNGRYRTRICDLHDVNVAL